MVVTFNAICSLLQGVENITAHRPRLSPKDGQEATRQTVANWFDNHRSALDDPNTNGGALLSALFPHLRKDRVYGLQSPLLARKLTRLLNFNHGQRALLDGWKTGKNGDLGTYVELAMKPWDGTFSSRRAISIERVDRLLTQLAARYRFSDASIRSQRDWHVETDSELKDVLVRLASWEAKWLVRLVLRNHCTVMLDERYIFKLYHFLLPDLLMFQNDFGAVFGMLRAELSCYPAVPDQSEEVPMRIEAAQKLKPVVGIKVGRPNFKKAWSFKHCFRLVGHHAWVAETKYDGEYCEIHIDLTNAPQDIKIFSKNGKDATADRKALHSTIREALRMGQWDCAFKSKCIVLGEMVLYSDKEKQIMPFSKIRKHISRSGSFIGTLQDSLPHEWEHLMIIFFDVLLLDDEPVLRHCLQERRKLLRDLVQVKPGRSMRSEWSLLDFKTGDGNVDLKEVFARNLASRQEGLVLKPLHAPYFPLIYGQGCRQPGYFIKLKKDYLGDMGGARDLGDFAVIGASFDAQVAPKSDMEPLHWTHFHLGCCANRNAVQRSGAKPMFQVVATVSLDKCIPKPDLKYLNVHGYVRQARLREDGQTDDFDIVPSKGFDRRMTTAFRTPFVVEVLGGGFEKPQNETFEMLRHPRVKKLHNDRTWEDCVTLEELEKMAEKKWDVPDPEQLDGHAKDVALLVSKYAKESQATSYNTTYDTAQTTPRRSEASSTLSPADAVVQETQQPTLDTNTTISPSTMFSGSTQGVGTRASRQARILVRKDIAERFALATPLKPPPAQSPVSPALTAPTPTAPPLTAHQRLAGLLLQPSSTAPVPTACRKRDRTQIVDFVSPPAVRRRGQTRTPLRDFGANGVRDLGAFHYDSQDKTIHIFAREGLKIDVHLENKSMMGKAKEQERQVPHRVEPCRH